ncbi:triose-phosphate isomerase [Candidatus Chlamydia sanziniae]|uniref:Triosephosphate isomerase n=1 Tax=Candidatus Chlamydia sanziniae TaxID=1806891 RepID=A0A1A9HVZ3_9CHLA|nr:triose-phosphate isomerase [Candidatus Chlamydia sanziniae]ANH78214.1 Triosephosphate isomerase [Candidatus Chlamydia sanziniae]
MARTRYVLGNWKMHKTAQDAKTYLSVFSSLLKEDPVSCTVGILPPYTALSICAEEIAKERSSLLLGAQNVYSATSGAFTGEISLPMLKEWHVDLVLLGHSERRHIFFENDAFIAAKVEATVQTNLLPVLCIGESLDVRERGKTEAVLQEQLLLGLERVSNNTEIVIAYEPVWAIGTGKVALATDVQRVHVFCRQVLARKFSQNEAERISILYGGSVKAENAQSLGACPDVDGLLVGGASLDPQQFFHVAKNFCF